MSSSQNSSSVLSLDGGTGVFFRDRSERMDEEVYRSISALSHLASAAAEVGNKLSLDARNALFFERGGDHELRVLKIENAMHARQAMESFQPDLEWLRGAAPVARQDFETRDNDLWLDGTS